MPNVSPARKGWGPRKPSSAGGAAPSCEECRASSAQIPNLPTQPSRAGLTFGIRASGPCIKHALDVLGFLPLSKHLSTNQNPPRITRMSRTRRILRQLQGKLSISFRNIRVIRAQRVRVIRGVFCFCFLLATACAQIGTHELSRPARPWEFLDAAGKHSGLFGNESGRFEAWVYPIKLFRDFEVTFIAADGRIPASSLVRRLTMRPAGPTLTFASDSFTVNETWLATPDENGAIIRLEVDAWQSIQIEASFTRDFQLMWPAGLGG